MISRRGLLGASAASLLLPRVARAAEPEKSAVVVIFFNGSYNAIFAGADAYVSNGCFGVTGDNVTDVGNGLVVDSSTMGQLPAEALQKMCSVGVAHGYSDHISGQRQFFIDKRSKSYPLQLAAAMGGDAAFRCAHFGATLPGDHPGIGGVSLIGVPDLSMPIALAAGSSAGEGPKRATMAAAFRRIRTASAPMFQQNPKSLRKTREGLDGLVTALEKPPSADVNWDEVATAYGLSPATTAAQSFTAQLAGAELMIRAGANVVTIHSMSWDHHGEWPQTRGRMSQEIIPALSTFLRRSLTMPGFNIVTALTGEFARTAGFPGAESGHAGGLSASVFGKDVVQGTTGRPIISLPDGGYGLPAGTPGTKEFWGFLSALARAPERPFGANAHAVLGG